MICVNNKHDSILSNLSRKRFLDMSAKSAVKFNSREESSSLEKKNLSSPVPVGRAHLKLCISKQCLLLGPTLASE